jgi:hypothetical protein
MAINNPSYKQLFKRIKIATLNKRPLSRIVLNYWLSWNRFAALP